METMSLKNELGDTEQNLDHVGTDLQTNETIITQMNENMEILKSRIEVQGLIILQLKDIADKLLEKVENDQNPLIGKKDIMRFFDKESDFALRFLRVAKSNGFGIQVGREYYIKREEFEKILSTYQGLSLKI